jgi:hypothetical protein
MLSSFRTPAGRGVPFLSVTGLTLTERNPTANPDGELIARLVPAIVECLASVGASDLHNGSRPRRQSGRRNPSGAYLTQVIAVARAWGRLGSRPHPLVCSS